jgi:sporulation integral membrane protein YtvI
LNSHIIQSTFRFLFVIVALFVGMFLFFYISKVTYPFIIGIIVAFLINPIVNLLERKGSMPRFIAVLITLMLVLSSVVAILYLLISELVSGTIYLAKVVPPHFQKLVEYLQQFFAAKIIPLYNQIAQMIKELNQEDQQTLIQKIEDVSGTIVDGASAIILGVLNGIQILLLSLPNAATVIIFSLLATFFISKDWYKLVAFAKRVIPQQAHESSISVFNELKKAFLGFIRAQFTLISFTAVIVLVGLLILRVDYAITIAIIIGIVDLLPYLGTGAVFIPWIVYIIVTGNYGFAIGLSILYVVVLVQRQVMEPKILSSNIGLDPLATLVALFVGFKVLGVFGLILGPVLLVIINALQRANVFENLWTFITAKKM